MPVISLGIKHKLFTKLAAELWDPTAGEEAAGRPIVFEFYDGDVKAGNSLLRVMVVWDEWGKEQLSADERAAVIRQAYADRGVDRIYATEVVGVTVAEAYARTLLPYVVLMGQADPIDLRKHPKLRALLLSLGGVEIHSGISLRLPTENYAKEALDKLTREFPDFRWWMTRVVSEVSTC